MKFDFSELVNLREFELTLETSPMNTEAGSNDEFPPLRIRFNHEVLNGYEKESESHQWLKGCL